MKKFLLISGIAALTALSAAAGTVTYTTTGVLGCGVASNCVAGSVSGGTYNGDSEITISTGPGGTSELIYAPNTGTTITSPTNTNFGALVNASQAGSTGNPFAGASLVLTISQTVPSGASGPFGSGAITGTIGISTVSIDAQVNFTSPTAITIGGETYTVFNPTNIVPVTSNGGVSTIEGSVVDAPVSNSPEPTTILLMGVGLGFLGLARRATR